MISTYLGRKKDRKTTHEGIQRRDSRGLLCFVREKPADIHNREEVLGTGLSIMSDILCWDQIHIFYSVHPAQQTVEIFIFPDIISQQISEIFSPENILIFEGKTFTPGSHL